MLYVNTDRLSTLIHEYSPFTLLRTAYEKYVLLYSVIQIRRKVGMIGKEKYLSNRRTLRVIPKDISCLNDQKQLEREGCVSMGLDP